MMTKDIALIQQILKKGETKFYNELIISLNIIRKKIQEKNKFIFLFYF